jgi:hypothetical protein
MRTPSTVRQTTLLSLHCVPALCGAGVLLQQVQRQGGQQAVRHSAQRLRAAL